MDRIGKYQVHDQIGSGGFATVYRGTDPFIKREVAIKICYANDLESRQRFHREAEIAGRLKHENITTVYDFGLHDEDPYLVEEYLDGEDLTLHLRRREPTDLATKLDYLMQIARGLEYAHREGVIHRDIKPGNVRVLDDGTLKIMDFGTAKLAGVESHLTQKGMTLGTVAYLSPERLLGREAGTNSDIFSYGVLAYELLTFRRPFSGRNIPHLIDQVLNAAPIPLTVSWPQCPPRLAEVVDRCLLKDPQERYATCSLILADLEELAVEVLGRMPATFRDDTTGVPLATGASPNVQVSGFFERARKLHAEGRHERAVMVLEEVLEMAPGHAEARALLDASRAALHDEATPSTETGLVGVEGPEERKARKRAEAVASIETFLTQGRIGDAADALAFAVRMFGPLRDVRGLSRRLVDAARRDLALVKGEALQASRRLLDQLVDLRHSGRLDVSTAEHMVRQILDFDPDHPAARDVLAMVRADAQRPAAAKTAESSEQARKWADAVVTIEDHLQRGDAETASRALAFAVSLYGQRPEAAALRQRIDLLIRSAGT